VTEKMNRPGEEITKAALDALCEGASDNGTPGGYFNGRDGEALSPTRQYLNAVYGDHTGTVFLALGTDPQLAKSGKYRQGRWNEVSFAWPADVDVLEAGIVEAADAGDVYLCVSLMSGRDRTPGDAVCLDVLHADVDNGNLDIDKAEKLGGFVVGSGTEGNGHVYIPMSEPVTPAQYTLLEQGLVAFLGADRGKIAANDVLRPPGTLNHKPSVMNGGGGLPTAVEWLIPPTGVRAEPNALADVLGVTLSETPPRGVRLKTHPATESDTQSEVVPDLETLYPDVFSALKRDTGDRSADTMRVVVVCHRSGLSLPQTRWVVSSRTDLAERLGERDDDDVARCWDKAGLGNGPELHDSGLGDWIRWNYLAGKFLSTQAFGWMEFNGRQWRPVPEIVVAEAVRQALLELLRSETERQAEPERLAKINRTLNANRIKAITYVVKLGLADDGQFDANPDLLNVANGVVDLRDGTLMPHDPALRLTKMVPVAYQPAARHPDWDLALDAVPEQSHAWLQERMGQAITGHAVPDDRLLILKGGGANGKTTLVDGIRYSIGSDYAVAMPERVLLSNPGDHPTELMTLRGARLAFMEELPELGHLNVKRVKDSLGTGAMTARLCGKDSVSWVPTHTPVVTTNYTPRVDESDNGTWRRLVMVEFPYTYRSPGTPLRTPFDREGDPGLRDRLREGRQGQHQAVLAWLIAGALRWYENSRVMSPDPDCVRSATEEWRSDVDVLMRYINDNLVADPESYVASTALLWDFNRWLDSHGHRGWSDQTFGPRFVHHRWVLDNRLERVRGIRPSRQGLSHPDGWGGGGSRLPKTFTAWIGVRFQN